MVTTLVLTKLLSYRTPALFPMLIPLLDRLAQQAQAGRPAQLELAKLALPDRLVLRRPLEQLAPLVILGLPETLDLPDRHQL